MNSTVFRHGLNLWPPFLFAGIHVTALSPDYRQADVELRMRPWNRNYVRTHFGGSLFAMTDPFWMLLVMHSLGREYIVWDRAGTIDFVKPGRGTVHARFRLEEAVLGELRHAAADGGKVLRWFDAEILDEGGDVVARVRKQLYVRRKRRHRDAGGGAGAPEADTSDPVSAPQTPATEPASGSQATG